MIELPTRVWVVIDYDMLSEPNVVGVYLSREEAEANMNEFCKIDSCLLDGRL